MATPSPSTVAPEDCLACRITGTLAFAGVGVYALTVARGMAKTRVGQGAASVVGLGFLTIAAARWNTDEPSTTTSK